MTTIGQKLENGQTVVQVVVHSNGMAFALTDAGEVVDCTGAHPAPTVQPGVLATHEGAEVLVEAFVFAEAGDEVVCRPTKRGADGFMSDSFRVAASEVAPVLEQPASPAAAIEWPTFNNPNRNLGPNGEILTEGQPS